MQLIPYIMFNGNCEEAINFYAKALNGKINTLSYFEGSPAETMTTDKKAVMHAHLSAKGVDIMASDETQKEARFEKGGMVRLSMSFDNANEQKQVFDALAQGGKVTMPLQDTFWGATFGMLTDKYGIGWMFNYDKPKQ